MRVHHRASGRGFFIAPLLDRGWGYDPYVGNLIGRIRAGRPAPECLFDSNSLFLRSGQDTDLQRYAAKKREISAEDMATYRAQAEKRRLAMAAVYAQQRADRLAQEAERKRIEQEWRVRQQEANRKWLKRQQEQEQEWDSATARPPPPAGDLRIPVAGWWHGRGDDVVVAVMLHRANDTQVLVGPEGAGLWIAKAQVKQVKNYLNGLHELTLDGDFAKRMGFCKGEPRRWIS